MRRCPKLPSGGTEEVSSTMWVQKLSLEGRCLPSGLGRKNNKETGTEEMGVWPVGS